MRHALDNSGTLYKVEFVDGESYVCEFDASYDSDNSGELDIEMDDPQYDEFHQIVFEIVETVCDGHRRYNN